MEKVGMSILDPDSFFYNNKQIMKLPLDGVAAGIYVPVMGQ
jgi:hypothetical protein